MATSSFRRQRASYSAIAASLLQWISKAVRRHRPTRLQPWPFVAALALLMLAWNWKLVLALGAGVGGAIAIFDLQQNGLRAWQVRARQWFAGVRGTFAAAAGAGGAIAFTTYTFAALWAEAENRWLAAATIVQTLATLGTLSLVGWHIRQFRSRDRDSQFDRHLANLADDDPRQRLVAVRQLERMLDAPHGDRLRQQTIVDCLYLSLQQESEPLVRDALFEVLQGVRVRRGRGGNALQASDRPVAIPNPARRSKAKPKTARASVRSHALEV